MEINEENIEIRNKLLNLPKVKTSENFLNELQNKIKRLELEKELSAAKPEAKGEGFFAKLFGAKRSPWLVPALGLGVVAVLVFSIILITNKNNITDGTEKVTSMSKEAPTTVTEQPNTNNESLNKEKLEGKEITEDFGTTDKSTGTTEHKYTDQGMNKIHSKGDVEVKSNGKEEVIKQNVVLPLNEQKSGDVTSEPSKNKSTDEISSDKKIMESEKKDSDKVGRMETSKKDSSKDNKKINGDAKEPAKSFQGSTEIDKNSLKDLRDKIIEKATKKKE